MSGAEASKATSHLHHHRVCVCVCVCVCHAPSACSMNHSPASSGWYSSRPPPCSSLSESNPALDEHPPCMTSVCSCMRFARSKRGLPGQSAAPSMAEDDTHTHTHTHTHTLMNAYSRDWQGAEHTSKGPYGHLLAHVCVCVCVRARVQMRTIAFWQGSSWPGLCPQIL